MPTPAVVRTIPAPANSQFINGEQGVGIPTAPAGGVYTFAREFVLPRSGLYFIKVWVRDGGVLKVLKSQIAVPLQTITLAPNQVATTQVYLTKGRVNINVDSEMADEVCFAMLIYQPGSVLYASTPAGWVFERAALITDAEVPDAIEPLPSVFTLLPNWGESITERLSYLTDIPTSETGAEQPRVVRHQPRRSFEASFLRKGAQRARLDHFLTGIGRRIFLMPLWHEQYRVQAELSDEVSFPAGTLKLREFMVGDKVFVNDGDPDRFEVLTVGSLNFDTDVMTFTGNPVQTWRAGTRIMPLRRARVVGQSQMSAPVDRVGGGRVAFELVDPEYRFGASWGRCSPVWHFDINRGEDITFSFERMSYALDTQVGIPEYDDPGNRAMVTQRSAVVLRGRADVVSYRRFIDMATGRAGRFYMPTRMQDIVPSGTSIGGASLDAVPTGFSEFIRSQQWARAIIAVVFNDGSPNIYRKISDVQRLGDVERFSLEVDLPVVNVNRIERIQFMVPSRFDQDSFDFEHVVDESAVVRTSAVTRSVDGDEMPDIDCFVTSEVYPLEVVEQIEPGLRFTGGDLLSMPIIVGALSLSLAFTDGQLQEPLRTYNSPAEAVNVDVSMDGGELRSALLAAAAEPESMSVVLDMTSGSLVVKLLSHVIEPEGVDVSLTFDGGSLT